MNQNKKFEIKQGVKVDLWDVVRRLDELGLTVAQISEPVQRGYLAAANCTTNHPPLMRGIVGWGEIVCALREGLMPQGWMRNDANNYSVVNDPVGNIAIAVATGDENTGIVSGSPSTKSPKGPQTVDAVNYNHAQLPLLFEDTVVVQLNEPSAKPQNLGRVTYILLVHRAPNEIRFELSLPDNISDDGKINGWIERIIFRAIPMNGDQIDLVPPMLPDVEIEIKRRAS